MPSCFWQYDALACGTLMYGGGGRTSRILLDPSNLGLWHSNLGLWHSEVPAIFTGMEVESRDQKEAVVRC